MRDPPGTGGSRRRGLPKRFVKFAKKEKLLVKAIIIISSLGLIASSFSAVIFSLFQSR